MLTAIRMVGEEERMVMSKAEFLGFLTPERKKLIIDCVKGGLADYGNPDYYPAISKVDHTPSVAAQIRNCHIVARARRACADHPEMVAILRRGRVLFTINDQVRVSFKKLDGKLRPHALPLRHHTDATGLAERFAPAGGQVDAGGGKHRAGRG